MNISNQRKKYCLLFFIFFLNSCSSKVIVQIVRPPIHKIENIEFVEIGDFQFIEGEITNESSPELESKKILIDKNKFLKPYITNFISNKKNSLQIVDLVISTIAHELSINSPFKIFFNNDTKFGFSGTIPDSEKVAILNGKIKFFEKKIESKEDLSYFTNIKNRGVSLEKAILARTISMGVEASGTGFKVPTPYVEQLAAIEVEFVLTKKSDLSNIVPRKTIRSYYAKKWGGDPYSSHLPRKTKNTILKNIKQEKEFSKKILSRIDKAGLSFSDPTEYFARGFNLKSNSLVPKTSLEIRIDLSRQIAKKYLKLISPYNEKSEMVVKDGDKIAETLINGNAFMEAISHLKGIENRNAEDEYNLGLSLEAIGDIKQANFFYRNAMEKNSAEDLYFKAVKRTKN